MKRRALNRAASQSYEVSLAI